jgi:DNA-binding GntR family transcriptional regulator
LKLHKRPKNSTGRAQKESSKTLTEQVYQRLRQHIIELYFPPGSTVSEAEVADLFEVSKTPAREALRLLERDGWIQLLPRKGYFVRPITFDDVSEFGAVRRLLEPYLVALATRRASESDLQRLRELDRQVTLSTSPMDRALMGLTFHEEIALIANSHRVTSFVIRVLNENRRVTGIMPHLAEGMQDLVDSHEHASLIGAMERRQPSEAARLMADHLDLRTREVEEEFQKVSRDWDPHRISGTRAEPSKLVLRKASSRHRNVS